MVFKRKASRKRSSNFKRARSRSSSSGSISPMNIMLAGAVYGFVRPIAAKMLPDLFNIGVVDSDNAIIGAAGYYGMKKSGFVKALGMVALASETGIVVARLTSATTDTSTQPTNITQGLDW